MRIGYFLPMIERTRINSGRRRRVLLPLFPGYVFFCGNEAQRYEAMRTNRLCRAIRVCDQERLICELTSLEKSLAAKARLDCYPMAAVGERCRVTAGPFKGLEGVVTEKAKRSVLVLQVSILGQGACMEISPDLVERA
jgi:transcription antitermination factor NusG